MKAEKPTEIKFLNQPLVPDHDSYRSNQLPEMIEEIKRYITDNPIFRGKVEVSFFHSGVSSLVTLVNASDSKFVLKIPFYSKDSGGESLLLKKWMIAGIKTPKIFDSGLFKSHSFVLMEYIDFPTLNNVYDKNEMIDIKLFYKLGSILQSMHKVEGTGFGNLNNDGTSEFDNFKDWITNDNDVKERLMFVKGHNLFPEDIYGTQENIISTLIEYAAKNPTSVFCHGDFVPSNILNTKPLTVFDPIPTFNIFYIDLTRNILKNIDSGYINPEVIDQFINGYFEKCNAGLDSKIFLSSLLFNAHMLTPQLYRGNKNQRIKNIKEFVLRYIKI